MSSIPRLAAFVPDSLPHINIQKNHIALFYQSIRSPGPVAPEDVECEGFDITYTRIAGDKSHPHAHRGAVVPSPLENDIHVKVDHAIEGFLKNLSQIGPELLSVRFLCCLVCVLLYLNGDRVLFRISEELHVVV